MIQMDLLDYEIYCDGKHIADIDDEKLARIYARLIANERMKPAFVIYKWTGELIVEYAIKKCVVEVKP